MTTAIVIYTFIMLLGGAPLIISLILGDLFDFADGALDWLDATFENIGIDLIPDDISIGNGKSGFGTMALMAFTTLFGCTGLIATTTFHANHVVSIIVSLVIGLLAAILTSRLMMILYRQQASNDILEKDFLNLTGQTSSLIQPGEIGRITVVIKGQTLRYPAKCTDETQRLETGTTIRIVRKEGSIVIIKKI